MDRAARIAARQAPSAAEPDSRAARIAARPASASPAAARRASAGPKRKKAFDAQQELEERTRKLSAVCIQTSVRRWQVQKAMPSLVPRLLQEKEQRAAQRRLDAWRSDRRRSEQPGYAFGSPRGKRISLAVGQAGAHTPAGSDSDWLMRRWLKGTTMTDAAMPHAQLLPAYTASKLLPSLDAKPRRGRRTSFTTTTPAEMSYAQPSELSEMCTQPVGHSPLSVLVGRSVSAPASRPPPASSTSISGRTPNGTDRTSSCSIVRPPARPAARALVCSTTDRLTELSDPKIRGYEEASIEYYSRLSQKEPTDEGARTSDAYRRPSQKNQGFLFSGNVAPSSRDNALKVTGKHSNINQIGPAAVPLSDLMTLSMPEAATPSTQQVLAQRSTSPPLIRVPRSEGNASGLVPEPSDRDLVQLVMAAHQHIRYSPVPRCGRATRGPESAGSKSPTLSQPSPSMLRPTTEGGSQCHSPSSLLRQTLASSEPALW